MKVKTTVALSLVLLSSQMSVAQTIHVEREVTVSRSHRQPHYQRRYHHVDRLDSSYGQFRRGRVLPRRYRSHNYYVNNWHVYGLYAPPRGQRWVQIGGEFVLIAVATGVITSILRNN